MRLVKEIIFSILFSNVITMNFVVICILISKLILGKFEYTFNFLYFGIIVIILSFIIFYLYHIFSVVERIEINELVHIILIIISAICFALYGITLDFYSTIKYGFDKSSEIYTELSFVPLLSLFSGLSIVISKMISFKSKWRNKKHKRGGTVLLSP